MRSTFFYVLLNVACLIRGSSSKCEMTLPCGVQNVASNWQNAEQHSSHTLRLVQIIFRHGDRAPAFTYPTDPYKDVKGIWGVASGELTTKGAVQHFNLGKYVREKYKDFLCNNYSANEVYYMSSNVDRSIASAQWNFKGLYSHLPDFVYGPVHTLHPTIDNVKCTTNNPKLHFSHKVLQCHAYNEEFAHRDKIVMDRLCTKERNLFKYLSTYTGRNITTWPDIYRLHDTLHIQDSYGLVLPEWTREVYPKELGQLSSKIPFLQVATKTLLKFRGGPLLKCILRQMELYRLPSTNNKCVCNDDPRSKLYMYSGHESTLVSLMAALGIYYWHIPPYASCIIVEMHEELGTLRDFIKVFYRNDSSREPFPMEIPGCGNPCYLETLKQLKKHILIDDWRKECNVGSYGIYGLTFAYLSAIRCLSSIGTALGHLWSAFCGCCLCILYVVIILAVYAVVSKILKTCM